MKISISNLSDLWEILKKAVELAEILWSSYQGAGEDKKAFVVDLINGKLDIPLVPEAIEEQLIGALVDLVVELVINN
jgi:hypothetical protein